MFGNPVRKCWEIIVEDKRHIFYTKEEANEFSKTLPSKHKVVRCWVQMVRGHAFTFRTKKEAQSVSIIL